jgi:hypothetical protein
MTLNELRITADTAVRTLNEAILTDKFSEINKATKALNNAVKEYNAEAIRIDFNTLKAKANPMVAAIEQLEIACIEAKRNEDKDTGAISWSIEPKPKQISLPLLDEHIAGKVGSRTGASIAVETGWTHKVDKLCLLLTYRVMKELNQQDTSKLEKTYFISDVAAQVDLGKTPTSNTALLKTLQTVIDAIIPDAKVVSHDVNYLVQTMTRRGRESGTVVAPRPATMHTLLMDVLHKIVCDKSYSVEYTSKKQAEKEAAESPKAPKTVLEAQADVGTDAEES